MEGYKKTEKLNLNMLEDNTLPDPIPIQENFEILEGIVDKLKDMELTDERVDCVEEKKKLNEVIKELREATKGNKDKIDGLKIDDEHVDVVFKKKKLNLVLADLEEKNKALDELIQKNIQVTKTYRDAEAEFAEALGIQVQKHKTANDRLESLLGGA